MKNPKTRLRNKASKMWKILIIDRHGPNCELCGGNWRITAHHFFYKSSSGHLRYDLNNGICLCAKCHARLHFRDPKLVEGEIIKKRGKKWYNKLEKKAHDKPKSSYLTIKYYNDKIKVLQAEE